MYATDELTGTVDRFLFHNAENGYTVFTLHVTKSATITVTGIVPGLQPGEQVTIKGSWTVHPKFGKQFELQSCVKKPPTSIGGLKKYLSSGLIKGIGKVYAEKLVNTFGTHVLEIIDKAPHRLEEVDGIGAGRAQKIIEAWKDQKEISAIMVFLQDKGASPAYANKIFKKYGAESIAKVQENPYRLAEDIWGIGFKMADQIAQNLGFESCSVQRIKAGIMHAITTAVSQGHLYVEVATLKEKALELLELTLEVAEKNLKLALHDLYNTGKIKLITHQEKHYITLTQHYFTEKGTAQRVLNLIERPSILEFDSNEIYTRLRTDTNKIQLNEEQQHGIMSCLQHKMTIITGGPGTGKTTLIKKLLEILEEHSIRYKLAAPTGRAAKRIIEGTGRHALTLHRLLEFDFATMSFVHNEHNALSVQFLIVDEASMIDIFLAHAIIKALPYDAHLVLIGDIDQLPSVGAGNFLHDMIASNKIPTVKLQHIFRQAQDSMIVVNAHRVNAGEFPLSHLPEAKRDFIFIKEDDPSKVPEHLKALFQSTLKKHYIAAHDATVLVPMHRGAAGTQKLNHDIQNFLNSDTSKPTLERAGSLFRVGDKVMQLKNNYDKNVFNGDIGIITAINTEDRILTIDFDERSIIYEYDELDEIVHAYAISIHKSQGSEYAAAIIIIFTQHFTLLQRNLVYTAITRAKKLCIVIGQSKAIAMAIRNNKGNERKTFLKEFLTTDLQCT